MHDPTYSCSNLAMFNISVMKYRYSTVYLKKELSAETSVISIKERKLKAMTTLRYKILLRKEEDSTYTVIVPSLPGCLTFGHTVEEALAMAKEAIEGFIACMIERGEEVPIETDDSLICTVAVEANA
jgi:predicted RNase H-like HicB family nuclease